MRPRCRRWARDRRPRGAAAPRSTNPRAPRAGRPPRRPAPHPRPPAPPTASPPWPAPERSAPAIQRAREPDSRGGSGAGGGGSRGGLVDPERSPQLPADRLGLVARGVGSQHDAVPVIGTLGREDARRESRAGELLRHLSRPGLVLGRGDLDVERALASSPRGGGVARTRLSTGLCVRERAAVAAA